MKASDTAEQALRGLLPKLQHFAVTPIEDEDDLAERKAFEQTLVAAAGRMYLFRLFPEKLIPGWDRAVGPFLSEIRAAEKALAARHSPAGYQQRLEANRAALLRQGRAPLVMPEIAAGDETGSNPPAGKGQSPAAPRPEIAPGSLRLRLSDVLDRYLAFRAGEDGDRRAESEVAPVIKFAINLLQDPVMLDIIGDDLLALKMAIPDIPTKFGLPFQASADLYHRWDWVACTRYEADIPNRAARMQRSQFDGDRVDTARGLVHLLGGATYIERRVREG